MFFNLKAMAATGKNIPVLTTDSYKKHYFKDLPPPSKLALDGFEHFEFYNRKNCRDNIKAHRLDFYMVQLVTSGNGVLRQGLRDYCIHSNMLAFTSPAMISSWKAADTQQDGFVVSFSDTFFNRGREDKRTLSNLPFFKMDGCATIALPPTEISDYIILFEMMQREFERAQALSGQVLREMVNVLLTKAKSHHLHSPAINIPSPASNRLLRMFTDLYMKDIGRIQVGREVTIRRISDYAKDLGVTQNHLNDSVREVTGKSAGTLVREQIIKQATMCLRQSSKSISEIAYLLGFQDPSYFSRYYKKQTGKLPTEVRIYIP